MRSIEGHGGGRFVAVMAPAFVLALALPACGGEAATGPGATTVPGAASGAPSSGAAGADPASGAAKAPLPPGVVEVEVTEKGFVPDRIPAKKGELLTMLVTRKTDKTCATEITMKEPPINKPLPLNVPVEVKLTPEKEGELLFVCAMGHVGGYIEVK